METSLYVALAAQRTLQRQLSTVANNIANSNTTGFRAESVNFSSLVVKSDDASVHFPSVGRIQPSEQEGSKTQTGNPLDIAVSGKGWLAISTPGGVAYTRDGRMNISAFGELQSLEGNPILDAGSAPIQIDTSSGPIKIQQDGRIVVNNRVVGNIGVFEIETENITGRYSNSSFFSSTAGVPIATGKATSIQQGYLESSNVNPLKELASLISITRNFESSSSLLEKADNVISKSINELSGA